MIKRILNVLPSIAKENDQYYQQQKIDLPQEVDLRIWDSPVEDQGMLGSCAANAVTSAYELMQKKEDADDFEELSKLFVYYHARYLEETINDDHGVMYLKSALEGLKQFGVCTEALWPYRLNNYAKQPTPNCYVDAFQRRIPAYSQVVTLVDILENIALGKPVVLGMTIYNSFMDLTKENSTIPLPAETEEEIGGHAVVIVGYSIPDSKFLIKNSFGTDWGNKGYAWMPFEYARLYVFDKWVFDINQT